MAFTSEQQQKITDKLGVKIAQPCPGCGQNMRRLIPELVSLTTSPTPVQIPLNALYWGRGKMPPPPFQPSFLPCIVVLCMNCGFTELYNVHILGVADVLGIPPPGGTAAT